MGVQWWTLRGGGSLAYRTLAGGGVSNTANRHTRSHKQTNKNTYKYNYGHTHTPRTTERSRDLKVHRLISNSNSNGKLCKGTAVSFVYHFLCVSLLLRVSSKLCEVFQNFLGACLKEVRRAHREKKCKSREGRRLLVATTSLANCRSAEKMSLKEGKASVQGKSLGQLLNISLYFICPMPWV